jgi:hypothetical protein
VNGKPDITQFQSKGRVGDKPTGTMKMR